MINFKPLFFSLDLKILTKHIQESIRDAFLIDDIVLRGESREESNGRLETSLRSV
ncbi:hypothetical protein MTR_5g085290 [Medicago truncatula]|uniref:Uncharacterized protein n=1 Tax=Medicago truncatula TaxID=3880 RepID=G7KH95_MEDTR|nr:hypothetical protein MTR_5g085290 [Medicago truncatula]